MSTSVEPSRSQQPRTIRYALYIHSNFDVGGAVDQNAVRVQRHNLQTHIAVCRAKGVDCTVETYEDVAQRGGALKRPALRRLLADAEAGKMDSVVTQDFDFVTLSPADRITIILHFRRCNVGITEMGRLPEHVATFLESRILGTKSYPSWELLRHRAARRRPIRCAVYVRGDGESKHRDWQRRTILKLFSRYLLWNAPCVAKIYEDIDPPSEQPALKRLLDDVRADKVDCVAVCTFDRLTGSLISHEELLATLRQHSVSLFTLRPEFFHLWGAKMETAWFGYVPRPRGLLHILSEDSPEGKNPTAPFPLFLGRGGYLRNLPPCGPS
jgi:DNA invertase Pin-like site-specific DNA recombinase